MISANTAVACTGNAATATKLVTAHTINGVAFDGTTDIDISVNYEDITNAPSTTGKQLFTSSGTFTVPTGITTVWVQLKGGGGGGGGANTSNTSTALGTGGYGGEGQVACLTPITVTSGQTIIVTIGAGGVGGSVNSIGGTGGATSFGTYLSAVGGGGGGLGTYTLIQVAGSQGSTTTTPVGALGTTGTSYDDISGLFHLHLPINIGGVGKGGTVSNAASAGTSGYVYIEW